MMWAEATSPLAYSVMWQVCEQCNTKGVSKQECDGLSHRNAPPQSNNRKVASLFPRNKERSIDFQPQLACRCCANSSRQLVAPLKLPAEREVPYFIMRRTTTYHSTTYSTVLLIQYYYSKSQMWLDQPSSSPAAKRRFFLTWEYENARQIKITHRSP